MKVERVIPVLVLVLVAAGIILAFRVIGSPEHARDVSLDQIRAGDLAAIARTMHDKYADSNLPATLSGSMLKRDPVTHEFYDYERSARKEYVLCATFAAESTPDIEPVPAQYYVMYPNTGAKFKHGVGHTCYSINVATGDPEPHLINAHAPPAR